MSTADRLSYLLRARCYEPAPLPQSLATRTPLGRRLRRAGRHIARQLTPFGWACIAAAVIGSIFGIAL
jgi:hypothetical protein